MRGLTANGKIIKKSSIAKLIALLSKKGKVVGPVQEKGLIGFKEITDPKDIAFEGQSWFPAKKFAFPQIQTLFSYKGMKVKHEEKIKPIVLFGLRLCDLNAFHINDLLYLDDPQDPYYNKRRKKIFLVGFNCDEPVDEYCFCSSMKLKPYFDLMLYDKGDSFHIKAGTEEGKKLIARLKSDSYTPKQLVCTNKLTNKDIKESYLSKDWEKGSDLCLSCGHCTNLCPTCQCFDIRDEPAPDGKSGKRVIEWDGCQFRDFTRVSGDHFFRESRNARFKHRIYHKIVYFKDKYDLYMCTGCGRCIRGCPKKIDWIKIANELKKL